MRVAVLGCGPAGMVATHSAVAAGADVTVYSNPRKSQMFGAQYLHAPIPGVPTVERRRVAYMLWGSADGYREKVYGLDDVEVSPQTLLGSHDAWDIRSTYDWLWNRYHNSIVSCTIGEDPKWLRRIPADIVVNTIPAHVICQNESHDFERTYIWAAGDAPERGIRVNTDGMRHGVRDIVKPDSVVCSGLAWHRWYRFSNIFGHCTIEWPGDLKRPADTASMVSKPIRTNCDCWSGSNLYNVGRYGAWKKGVLVHHVYDQVKELLR